MKKVKKHKVFTMRSNGIGELDSGLEPGHHLCNLPVLDKAMRGENFRFLPSVKTRRSNAIHRPIDFSFTNLHSTRRPSVCLSVSHDSENIILGSTNSVNYDPVL